jgi:hypothetical protein
MCHPNRERSKRYGPRQGWTRCGLRRMPSSRLADEVRYSILPILIGDVIPFFDKLDRDIALHLAEVKAYKSGMVELRYEVRGHRGESQNAT